MSEIFCISYFDEIYGPSIFYCNVPSLDDPDYPDLTRILDFNEEEGSFIFAFRRYQTVNHLFYNQSDLARGGRDLLMITYMVKSAYFQNEIVDVFKYLDSKKGVLINYASDLRKLEQFPAVLREKKRDNRNLNVLNIKNEGFKKKFLNQFKKYFDIISYKPLEMPLRNEIISSKKIFILGTPHSGKTTFLKSIEGTKNFMQNNPGLPTQIYEIIIDSLALLSYDCFEKNLKCSQCENLGGCIGKAQGFVVVLDLTDKKSILAARDHFYSIINSCGLIESIKIPVLLIGNMMNGNDKFDDDFIAKTFEFEELESCGMKMRYFKFNLQKEEKQLIKALRWMIKHML